MGFATFVVIGIVIALVLPAAGTTTTSRGVVTGTPEPAPAASDPMSVTAEALDAVLSEKAPTIYAGLTVDPHRRLVIIHAVETTVIDRHTIRTLVADTLEQHVRGSVLPLTAVQYVPAKLTKVQLLRETDLLTQAQAALHERGITLESWGPDFMHNALDVRVYNPKARARPVSEPRSVVRAIEAIVGNVNVEVQGDTPVEPA